MSLTSGRWMDNEYFTCLLTYYTTVIETGLVSI